MQRVDIRKPARVVGTTTVSSLQSGLYYGYLGLVDGVLERLLGELGTAKVVATGGLAALIGAGYAPLLGLAAWAIMALLFVPTARLYGVSRWGGVALPAIALAYLVFTVNSAIQSARGKGGLWKGRFQATRAK